MEFKAKRRKLKVTIDEMTFEVKFPTLGELSEYRAKVKDAPESEEHLAEFMASLGLPKDAQKSLEPSDISEIVGLLTDQKKA